VDNNKQALRQLAFVDDPDFDFKHSDIVFDQLFWIQLADLLLILEPLHTLQIMSEDNCATLSYVYGRWATIYTKLSAISESSNTFALDLKDFIADSAGTPWKERFTRQLTPIHTAAFFLHPKNWDHKMSKHELQQIIHTFNKHTTSSKTALQQFFDFRYHRGSFYPTSHAWTYKNKPKLFWSYIQTTCPMLSSFADQLMTTCANSVPSERAWSSMNFIYSKT